MSTGALHRLIRHGTGRRAAEERCDLCREPLVAEHRHLVDVDRRELMCACRACAVLFDRDAAGHYRLVPRRRHRLAPVPTASLGIPVGLAFFVVRADGTALAHYPGPAGVAVWEVAAPAWRQVADQRPELDHMAPEVEALLVNTARGHQEHWIVPVDVCYRLVAVLRREWRGLSGGSAVWPAIEGFFAELAADPR